MRPPIVLPGLLAAMMVWVAAIATPGRAAEPAGPRSGRWAHETSKLAPDERVIWGRLDNGFRYALLPHQGVPGRVALQLLVLAGSLDEKPDELGIAHYTEHLAFGGSKEFLPGEMVLLFQRLGIEYGSDVNANTTFDYTAYRLDYRENTEQLLRDGLRMFRGFADGLTFDSAIIERERKVVLAELRLRDTLAGQKLQASMPVVFRGLKFPARSPGGKTELIAHFTREQFIQFYRRCYRSDVMVLIATGDFDPAAMAGLIQAQFASMEKPREALPVRDEGRLDARNLRAGVLSVPGLGAAFTEVAAVLPRPAVDTREAHIERQQREFVMRLFSDRVRTDIPNASNGEASYEELLGQGVATAAVAVPGTEWSHGVLALDQLVRSTLERGLFADDLETARRNDLRISTHLADQLPTMDPGTHAEALLNSITGHTVFVGLERESAWRREWLEKITLADTQKIFRTLWAPATVAFQVTGGVGVELTPEKVLAQVQRYRKGGVSYPLPRVHTPEVEFKLPKWNPPSTVAERRELPELGVRLMRFGNNTRLNFVPNHQEPGLVRAVVRIGTGLLEMPGNRPALKEFGLNTMLASGTEHFRPDRVRALIGERFLEFSFDIADLDAFTFRGTMAVEQLETFLGLVADFLNEPRFDNSAHAEQRLNAAMGRMAGSTGMGDGMRALNDKLFAGDARFTSGTPLDYISMGSIDVKRWMDAPLRQGYVEASVVGDLTEETVVPVFSRTLGALGPRPARKAPAATLKPIAVSARPGFERIEFTGEQNFGLAVGTWPITDMNHVRDQAALEVLAKILEIRVRTEVREKLGLAYSPSADLNPYDGFPGFALLQTHIDCGPQDADRVARLVQTIAGDLAAKGATEGEFIGSRGILASQVRRAFRENGFLVNLLIRAQERPAETEEIVALRGNLVEAVSLDEVNRWAAKILAPENCRAASVVPKAFIGVFEIPDKP